MRRHTDLLWKGTFGDEYNVRNELKDSIARNTAFFARALAKIGQAPRIVIEFGCGTGQNIVAIERLFPEIAAGGIEINEEAAKVARTRGINVWETSAADWDGAGAKADLVVSKGFLIHIPPGDLEAVYRKIVETSNRYILIAEYYNPSPVEIEYRGERDRLWKRDFATEMMGVFPALRVVDYGFIWRHDYPWQQDDLTYFLLEKR